jgi:hypothetical protein
MPLSVTPEIAQSVRKYQEQGFSQREIARRFIAYCGGNGIPSMSGKIPIGKKSCVRSVAQAAVAWCINGPAWLVNYRRESTVRRRKSNELRSPKKNSQLFKRNQPCL